MVNGACRGKILASVTRRREVVAAVIGATCSLHGVLRKSDLSRDGLRKNGLR
jgi:hypothetical protein